MFNVWATVCTIFHLPRMFPPTDFLFGKRIGLVFMDLIYIIFTYYTQDNRQECFRLSNWVSLWCLRPWMNHLPPVWWSNFRFMFVNESWYVSLTLWKKILLAFSFYYWFYTLPKWYLYYSSHTVSLRNSFFILSTIIFHGRSHYSFLSCT